MPKFHRYEGTDGEGVLAFVCPGCKADHPFRIASDRSHPNQPVWDVSGEGDNLTFTPSLLCNGSIPESRCHSYVTAGRILFLEDCAHSLRGEHEILDYDG